MNYTFCENYSRLQLYSDKRTQGRKGVILAPIGVKIPSTQQSEQTTDISQLSREEVEAMLGLTLEQTRVYQEAKAEGREEGREEREAEMLRVTVPLLLKTGMTVSQIAQQLNVDVEAVRLAAQQST